MNEFFDVIKIAGGETAPPLFTSFCTEGRYF